MTNSELSNEFDILYNNITSNQAPGLDVYEKSVFLTKAQRQLVNDYFNIKVDGVGGGFDGSQRRQYDFSSITKVTNLLEVNYFDDRIKDSEKLDKRSKVYLFPTDYFISINEMLLEENQRHSIIPLHHIEYQRLMSKPYNLPSKRKAWRLFTGNKGCNYYYEVIDADNQENTSEYTILTSWADYNRSLELTIKVINDRTAFEVNFEKMYSIENQDYYVVVDNSNIYFKKNNDSSVHKIECDTYLDSDKNKYITSVSLNTIQGQFAVMHNDVEALHLLQIGFYLLKKFAIETEVWSSQYKTVQVAKLTDGFHKCSIAGNTENFSTGTGKTFTTNVVMLPIAEVIGNFTSNPEYKLRYLKTLRPIILEDLDIYGEDLKIDGVSKYSESELPDELHQEILDRAVLLAKIAWQGTALNNSMQSQGNSKKNKTSKEED